MSRTYHWQLTVRTYETDHQGAVQDYYYIHYLQETATQASTDAGYSMQWYLANQRLWLLRTLTVRYDAPAFSEDTLDLYSWVSDSRRVQSHREYRVLRGDTRILRARANWVYMDMASMQPTRIPPLFDSDFGAHTDPLENLESPLTALEPAPNMPLIAQRRGVEPYEIDVAGHVNNGVYPRWLQSASAAVWQQVQQPMPRLRWRRMEYRKPALAADPIEIVTEVRGTSGDLIEVAHVIRHAEDHSIFVEDTQLYDAAGIDRSP